MNILSINFVPEKFIGVKNKIKSQNKCFKEHADNFYAAEYFGNEFLINESVIAKLLGKSALLRKVHEPFVFFKIISDLKKCKDIDLIYLRYMRITPWFYIFILFLKSRTKKLVIEIPSFPYDFEFKKGSPLSISDKFFRTRLKGIVDLFTFFGDEKDTIFGVKALGLKNGVDATSIPISENYSYQGIVNIVCVANFSRWHGYDRLINSFENVSNELKNSFRVHFVGEGTELEYLKKLTSVIGIDNIVKFYGPLSGKELDNVFNCNCIGAASLGLYRIGQERLTPLKPAEYVARGIPIILANDDPRFIGEDFVYRVPNNDSLLDLNDIISWYQTHDFNSKYIRNFATTNLAWSSQISLIFESFNF